MEILNEYLELAETEQWEKALPLIEKIISTNPNINTSWFNYGVCLEALGRYDDASSSFLKAYQINPEYYSAQYRIFRSLSLAGNENGFSNFLAEEIIKAPEIVELLEEDEDFAEIISMPKVRSIIQNNSGGQ